MQTIAWVAAALIVVSVVALIPATLARSKGRSFSAWWLASVLMLGIFAVIPVALLPTYRCRDCREVINPTARVCPHCKAAVPPRLRPAVATPQTRSSISDVGVAVILGGSSLVALAVTVLVPWVASRGDDPMPAAGVAGLAVGLALFFAVLLGVAFTTVLRQPQRR